MSDKAGLLLPAGEPSGASTPPAEERVTSFLTRVKKEVTKKESTLSRSLGLTIEGSENPAWMTLTYSSRQHAILDCLLSKSPQSALRIQPVLLDDSACSGTDPMGWKTSRQSRLAMQVLEGAEQRAFFGDFLHGQRKVTRSAAGGVQALALASYPLRRGRSGSSGSRKLPAPPQAEWKLFTEKRS